MRQFKDGAHGAQRQGARRRPSIPGGIVKALSGVALIGLGVSGGWAVPQPSDAQAVGMGSPRLVVVFAEVDLGELPKGGAEEATFELRNDGDANLRILGAKSGCACAVAEYDEVIPPGEVGLLKATLYTETLTGEVAKAITVETNDPESPRAILTLRATVVTAIRVVPGTRIILRNYAGSDRVRRLVRRGAISGHGFFNITGLRASVPWLEVRARKIRQPEPKAEDLPAAYPGDWILELALAERAPYGRDLQTVEFKTGLERQPLVKLTVLTEVAAPVELPVRQLLLSPGDGAADNMLAFSVREGLDPEALRVDAQPEGLSVELRPGEGRSLTAHVRWKGGTLEGGTLVFRIAGEQFELRVARAASD